MSIPPMRAFLLPFLLVAAFLTASCGGGGDETAPPPPRSWTFLVYLDGDNSLSNAALADLEEMRLATSSPYVNIIVQMDRQGVSTRRYRVAGGQLELLSDLGELDMASEQTVTDFLVWAKSAYPADRTALVLWDHGNGWDQLDTPTATAQQAPLSIVTSILNDSDNNSSFLSNYRVRRAIMASGIKLDLLGIDGCNMSTIEALYEFRELAGVIVASEELVSDLGWDYRALLSGLAARPGMTVEEFAGLAVTSYRNFYETIPAPEKSATMAAIRSSSLDAIAAGINAVALELGSRLDDPATRAATLSLISQARANVQQIDLYAQAYVYVDLVDLISRLGIASTLPELVSAAMIAEYHGSARPGAHGISIVFFRLPEAKTFNTYDANYRNYDPLTISGNRGEFINTFQWDELLAKYYSYAGL